MRVDDETSEVGPGDGVLTKNGSSHGLENIGETDLRLIVVGGNV
jgi:mannose-6-phosphate isomerase-like protein (cupin superfamily)